MTATPQRRRRSLGLAVVLLVVLASCRQQPAVSTSPGGDSGPELVQAPIAEQMTRTAERLARLLDEHPELLPASGDPDRPAVAVIFDSRDQPGPPVGPIAIRGSSLAYERARAARRTRPSDHFVLMTDAQGLEALYWAPVSAPDRLRVEDLRDPNEPSAFETVNPAHRVTVRLPFIENALVTLYRADGQRPILPEHILAFSELPPVVASATKGDPR
ncbi:MAG: hypothetical protein JSV80_07240 [Acidobacteriota bacterium]|nr:MAG: hypothetical protein JSV80_07240 [Acidobacteriota bacterium]